MRLSRFLTRYFVRQDTPPIRQSPDCFNDGLNGRPTAQDYMVSRVNETQLGWFIHTKNLSLETESEYSDDYFWFDLMINPAINHNAFRSVCVCTHFHTWVENKHQMWIWSVKVEIYEMKVRKVWNWKLFFSRMARSVSLVSPFSQQVSRLSLYFWKSFSSSKRVRNNNKIVLCHNKISSARIVNRKVGNFHFGKFNDELIQDLNENIV